MKRTIFFIVLGAMLTACEAQEKTETKQTEITAPKKTAMEIIIDRDHRAELEKAFLSDQEGNLLLPGEALIGKENEFGRTFKDDYDNAGPWVTGENELYNMTIAGSTYSIEHKDNNATHFTYVPLAITENSNWSIEAEFKTIDLPAGNSFGLTSGLDDKTNSKHLFLINSNDKTFTISYLNNSDYKITVQNKKSNAIKEGVNVLRIEQIDQFWHFFINGYLVHCSASQHLFGDKFGIGMDGAGKLEVAYFSIQW